MALDASELWQRGRRRRMLLRSSGPVVAIVAVLVVALVWSPGTEHRSTPPQLTVTPTPTTTPAAPCPGAERDAMSITRTPGLQAIQFVNQSTGWAVGDQSILATTDGGAHWAPQLQQSDLGLTSVDFIDSQHGWAAGPDSLLRTTDGGQSWKTLALPCEPLLSIHFVTPTVGYGIGDEVDTNLGVADKGGVLLTTADGGGSWATIRTPTHPQSACFWDEGQGWLGADGDAYSTIDNGLHWQKGLIPNPHWSILDVHCGATDAAWAVSRPPNGVGGGVPQGIYQFLGAGWKGIMYAGTGGAPAGVTAAAPGNPGPVSVIDSDNAAFLGKCDNCGTAGATGLAVSLNHGSTISRPGDSGNVPDLNTPTGASFITPKLGWVTGQHTDNARKHPTTRILRTIDGGVTWTVQFDGGSKSEKNCPTDARTTEAPCAAGTYLETDIDGDGTTDHIALAPNQLVIDTSTGHFSTPVTANASERVAGISDLNRDGAPEILLASTAGGCCGYHLNDATFSLWKFAGTGLVQEKDPDGIFRANSGRGDQYLGFTCNADGSVTSVRGLLSSPDGRQTWTSTVYRLNANTWIGQATAPQQHSGTKDQLIAATRITGCSGLGPDGFIPVQP